MIDLERGRTLILNGFQARDLDCNQIIKLSYATDIIKPQMQKPVPLTTTFRSLKLIRIEFD
jgi:hypothetical protein